ncbi:chemotaxis protein [Subsaximicrobium wynnwilliamsii]|uniref:Chemotaxis protein n=1 Tax=Subsaximicrobium wynnwilliamsii TaxID=291179 RepID=A0A5C6ZMT5_9FLAO|nr:MCP four helix bundle domain-containing protein [Subsaximicrobium wynnwilliamsii]TXD85106.1 chemotaxis protein [Subsaximicrobium wynnwilliamsii]TXD91149.1 chemotaxis protein [Subsaximicrobium wynnwilliamsii]TXE04543.1 chemotaxis protein [Subsaximicrobium wynnwilliamsii]
MNFYNKVKWVLGILMVFILILSTNLIDRNNFARVKESVVTLYEDRLVANDLIFEMSRLIHEKDISLATNDSLYFSKRNRQVNEEINDNLAQFELTRLTRKEEQVFDELKSNIETLMTVETNLERLWPNQNTKASNRISKIRINLHELSKIQLNEGKRQLSISKKAMNTVELFTQIEIYLLIFLAIVIQIIVMYNPKRKEETE